MTNGLFEDEAFERVWEAAWGGVTGATGALAVEEFFFGAIMRVVGHLRIMGAWYCGFAEAEDEVRGWYGSGTGDVVMKPRCNLGELLEWGTNTSLLTSTSQPTHNHSLEHQTHTSETSLKWYR